MAEITERAAQEKAEALAEYLGKGWTPKAWQNLGYHYRACKGLMEVHPSFNGFTAYFNVHPQVVVHGKDAREVVLSALFKAEAIIKALRGEIDVVSE